MDTTTFPADSLLWTQRRHVLELRSSEAIVASLSLPRLFSRSVFAEVKGERWEVRELGHSRTISVVDSSGEILASARPGDAQGGEMDGELLLEWRKRSRVGREHIWIRKGATALTFVCETVWADSKWKVRVSSDEQAIRTHLLLLSVLGRYFIAAGLDEMVMNVVRRAGSVAGDPSRQRIMVDALLTNVT